MNSGPSSVRYTGHTMVTTKPSTQSTYEDYLETPDDERWELLNGELHMAPSPKMSHQDAQAKLGSRLSNFVEGRNLGRVYFAPRRRCTVGYERGAARPAVRVQGA